MLLGSGTRLGPYEILSAIGAGGMGEVYRARDTRLKRDVAIKVVSADFATDPERLARFEQEARAAAALNHPNILAVYDIGARDRVPYIVSELLEGETLREHIGTLGVRKAIDYAIQMAHGLATAHEKGVVHRDLKPENVFVTSDGRIKILDFGLAKLVPAAPGEEATMLSTTPPQTAAGVVFGTTGYMSPEQVRGRDADQRSDVFAFGAILYEMLGGQRAFGGETAIDRMSAILKADPPVLPIVDRRIPPAVARIVERCLDKNAAARFQSMRDVAFALEAVSSAPESGAEAVLAGNRAPNVARARVAWAIAAVSVFALIVMAGALTLSRLRQQPADPVVRFQIGAPEGYAIIAQGLAISPDGRHVVYSVLPALSSDDERTRLAVRSLDSTDARVVDGTEGAAQPFWSPDSRSVAFFVSGKLRRIDIDGGLPQTIAESGDATNGTWSREGVILFSGARSNVLSRVPASGGEVTSATTLDPALHEEWHHTPSFLPDGRHFLFLAGPPPVVYVGSIDSKERIRLIPSDTRAVYGSGHLLFVRERRLFAQPFDANTFTVSGDAVPIADDIVNNPANSIAGVSASATGALIYRHGALTPSAGRLVWFDRAGKQAGTAGEGSLFQEIELSPDGKRFAASVADPATRAVDIWVFDLARNVGTRLTFDDAIHTSPKWSPSGDRLIYNEVAPGRARFAIKSADGTGSEREIAVSGSIAVPDSWYGDAHSFVFEVSDPKTSWDIWTSPVDKPNPQPLIQMPGRQEMAAVSADGQWLAYRSTESGRSEIYVTRLPGATAKWQISTAGGVSPRWRRDGRELYFLSLDRKLMAVAVTGTANGFEAAQPMPLFEPPAVPTWNWPYDVTADGQKFLINIAASQAEQQINVVLNWTNGIDRGR